MSQQRVIGVGLLGCAVGLAVGSALPDLYVTALGALVAGAFLLLGSLE